MADAVRRVIDPNAFYGDAQQPYDASSEGLIDPNTGTPAQPNAVPFSGGGPTTTSSTSTESKSHFGGPESDTGGDVAPTASGITELPDGAGGTVPVPPPAVVDPMSVDPSARGGSLPFVAGPAVGDPIVGPEASLPLPSGGPIGDPMVAPAITPPPIPTSPADASPWMTADPSVPMNAATPKAPTPIPTAPVSLPTFTPENNLIGTTVLPTVDPRATAQISAGDTGLAAEDAAPDIKVPSADPRLMRYRGETDTLMDKILHGPDRLKMAEGFYNDFNTATEPDYNRSLQDATDMGAAHGILHSGMLTNRYGDLAQRRLLDKETQKRAFLNQALEGTISDRNLALDQLQGVEKGIYGENSSDNEQLAAERANRQALIAAHYNQGQTALNNARTNRDEVRGERDYQSGLSRDAQSTRIGQYGAETGAENTDFGQGLSLFGAGNTGDPTGTYQTAAEQASLEAAAAAGDTAALLKLMAMKGAYGQGLQPAGG